MSVPRHAHPTRSRRLVPRVAAVVALAAGTALVLAGSQPVSAGIVPTVPLATADGYSVLAATTVTNTGPSVLGQSVGLSPGTETPGLLAGNVLPPATIEVANDIALQAQSDLTIAYGNAAGRSVEFTQTNPDLVGQTLIPGVYAATAKAPLALSGALVLDGQHDPDAVFIFQTDSTLITGSASTISLINGASECNVFWQVGSSATLGSGSVFVGTILALTSITVNTGAVVQGRALAQTGAVTLDTNVFTQPSCVPTPYIPIVVAPATTTTTTPATTAPATTAPSAATTVAAGVTVPTSPVATTPPSPGETVPPATVGDVTTTTYDFTVTDITLPRTGGTLGAQSGIGLVVVLIGLAALAIARRPRPA